MSILHLTNNDFYVDNGKKGKVMCTTQKDILFAFFHLNDNECSNCTTMIPEFVTVAKRLPQIKYALVNLSKYPDIFKKTVDTIAPIKYVPYLIIFVNNRPFLRYDGGKSSSEMYEFIKELLENMPKYLPHYQPSQQQSQPQGNPYQQPPPQQPPPQQSQPQGNPYQQPQYQLQGQQYQQSQQYPQHGQQQSQPSQGALVSSTTKFNSEVPVYPAGGIPYNVVCDKNTGLCYLSFEELMKKK